jgi:protocatechuate 3,4-dioxygenase beta subunit
MKNPGRITFDHKGFDEHHWSLSRRSILRGALAIGAGIAAASPRVVAAAPQCVTTSKMPIEGPYFYGDPEAKTNTGSGVLIRGVIWDAATCQPIPGATIVRWHSNRAGMYEDYFRGRMTSDATGAYEMQTVVPGIYAGLDRHVHFHVWAPGYTDVVGQIQWANTGLPDAENEFNFALKKGPETRDFTSK